MCDVPVRGSACLLVYQSWASDFSAFPFCRCNGALRPASLMISHKLSRRLSSDALWYSCPQDHVHRILFCSNSYKLHLSYTDVATPPPSNCPRGSPKASPSAVHSLTHSESRLATRDSRLATRQLLTQPGWDAASLLLFEQALVCMCLQQVCAPWRCSARWCAQST